MIRRLALAAPAALLAACTQPVPPGAQITILHPPSGVTAGPDVSLSVAGQAWGPGFHSEGFGGDVGIDDWWVPRIGLTLTVAVDKRPVRRLARGVVHRVQLQHLAPGHREITISCGWLRRRIVVDVADPPPVQFAPADPEPPPPAPMANAVAEEARKRGAQSHRLLRSGSALLAVFEDGDGWALWRLPLDPQAAGGRLRSPPDAAAPKGSASIYPSFVACGDGAFLAVFPGAEPVAYRLGQEGVQSRRWSIADVSQEAARHRLDIDPAPDALDAYCFGPAAAVVGQALREEGGGRYREGRYAVLLPSNGPQRLLWMPPEGGWFESDGPVVPAGLAPGRGLVPIRLDDGSWRVLLSSGVLAPLEGGRPAVALPLPPGEESRGLDRPLPYSRNRPTWIVRSGQPPLLEAHDPAGGDALYRMIAAGPAE